MLWRRSLPALVTFPFLVAIPQAPAQKSPTRPKAAAVAVAIAIALDALFESEWDYRMEQNPTWASSLGDRRWNERRPDLGLEAIERRHAHAVGILEKLRAIDRRRLGAGDRLDYDLFRKEYEADVEEHKELGERFDLREFHDAVLGAGALPLDLRERNVVQWIEGRRR